ncbi:MAG TPA: MBL fold metallo-hydrolase [Vicinamibacterales bacterium]|nr:MBL fold metallo-hydrolase [Vicinamibacterales bacterium]
MRRMTVLAGACVVMLAGASLIAQQARSTTAAGPTLQSAVAALNVTSLRSVQFTATGRSFVLGQPATATEPWPARQIKSYTAQIEYVTNSMRIEQVVTMPTPAPRGGGAAITGEQRQVQYVRGAYAWNETQPAGGGAPTFQSQPAASAERVLWLWAATPQGALKAAGATLAKPVADGAQIELTVGGRYPLHVHINKLNQVDRVRAWMPNDVFGDMLVETTYSGYRNFNGIPFPSRIVQSQGGYPTLDLTVTAVQINPFVDITVPDAVRNAPPPAAVTAASEKVADGVYWITGGSHHSLAVDMGDHVVIIEAPQNEARSDAVIAETKKLMANKPIRMVINTHLHFDHSGGLRRYVAEDATIVTHAANQAFYEKAWAGPRTLAPDAMSKSGKKPLFQGVTDRTVLRGSNNRTIELHVLQGNPHNEQLLVAWLPAEKILFQSDMINPPAANAQIPPPTPTISNFYDNLARLKIQPDRIVGGHGARIATVADLNLLAGKK